MSRQFLWLLAVQILLSVSPSVWAQASTNRPSLWAQKLDIAGIENCYQVTASLYRGAQPTAEGMARLQEQGVRLVVNLRMLRDDSRIVRGTGLKRLDVSMVPWHASTGDVVRFLKAVTNTNNQPVFIHCQHGADRTGFMCAMYRVAVCGWTKEAAIAEMESGGFHFNPTWQPLVNFIQHADIDQIRRRAGLETVQNDFGHSINLLRRIADTRS